MLGEYEFSPDGRRSSSHRTSTAVRRSPSRTSTAAASGHWTSETWPPVDLRIDRRTAGRSHSSAAEGPATGHGYIAVDVARPDLRPVVDPSNLFVDAPRGPRRITDRLHLVGRRIPERRTYVVAADGTGTAIVANPPAPSWSDPIVVERWHAPVHLRGYADRVTRMFDRLVVPADGSGSGSRSVRASINGECCADFEWAPDDSGSSVMPSDIAAGAPDSSR